MQGSELDVVGVFVLVVSYMFKDLAFQLVKCVTELSLMFGIAGFLTVDLVTEQSYFGT